MPRKTLPYVACDCKKCKRRFLFKDYNNAQNNPATWAYCPECCKELGIDFNKQTPHKNKNVKTSQE